MIRLAFLLALLLPVTAQANNPLSVASIMPSCQAAVVNIEDPGAFRCLMYVSGVSDVVTSNVLDIRIVPACPPAGTTTYDILLNFVAWADRHPEFAHENQFRGLIASLMARYPC